ncbi:flavin-containing monooxygenase [Mycolicibacterium fortuitum]|uniref:flavin-containing monooxygenase n=1 Tax=Mycolicibacterium fortuitum TaxID=1766 RepID=UPI0003FB1416|nr:NAD(P)/FAD-dependent oxidoreductase [Mycolicibacterium fortuitum]AIY47749.1 Flavin-containing monooxygenase [Mycobacterium sp. VKM Ac-1817D]CRL53981.1 flavin-containing monooxygenase FMO [Mycolicibacterium fortuitum subsp. fortuitum DSM 46621 = ATCC 6841 = JCM 6387]CRL79439.1 flavin-containing monooxygenase FMO [Mycolicibacter nonchromogenicus]WEV31299.1 NAD(P)/FAD-dependent oxidoreductase [Mycolicibacterium fortuitum]BDE00293.1 FAD-dependent oxidoreductase [Mycolicibacterium fortuitum subs
MTQTTAAPLATLSPQERVDVWLADFESALADRDIERVVGKFATDSFWRDLVSFTWNLKTVEGRDGIADMLTARLHDTDPSRFRTSETPTEEFDGEHVVTSAFIEFETAAGRGKGHLRLRDELGWTLLTTLQELKGHEERKGANRPLGAVHGSDPDRRSWAEKRLDEDLTLGYTEQPYTVVIGGGQGGIALGARLRQLGVPTIVVDQHERPGDQWRKRYKSLCLHDPVWYDHLPYLPFPANWPVFAPKDKIGDWLEFYTRVMEVPYWSSTTCVSASYDEGERRWTVEVNRNGEPVTLRPVQLVLATGMSGKPSIPTLPGQEVFRGDQHHSSHHPGPDQYVGKRVVVIGSNNSAHDICKALYENYVDVTMVQRSSTHVVKSESLMELGLGDLYSERAVAAGMTTEKADLTFASLPYRIMADFQRPIYDAIRQRDKDFYARLEAAGFDLDFGDDDSGLFMKYLRRGSGYYIDVGACELIADGSIKLAHGEVERLTENSVILADGTELPADVVVYATGFGSMNGWAADLISQEVADRIGKVWGLGSGTTKDPGPWEGEQRNMWKPTQQPNLWLHGGNLHQSRHYSLYLALQLKARYEGLATPVYGLQEVHHLS